jgi:hypothetical protein
VKGQVGQFIIPHVQIQHVDLKLEALLQEFLVFIQVSAEDIGTFSNGIAAIAIAIAVTNVIVEKVKLSLAMARYQHF